MKLVKVKKRGQLRVDMDPEELGYLEALANKVSSWAATEIYPLVDEWAVDKGDMPHNLISNSIEQVMKDANLDSKYTPSGNTGYTVTKQ